MKSTQEYEKKEFEMFLEEAFKDAHDKEEILKNAEDGKLKFEKISHLYHELSRLTLRFLVKYENDLELLNKGYSNLLELLSNIIEFKPIIHQEEEERGKATEHLWRNRELFDETMQHYVRQLENLRRENYNKILVVVSLASIAINYFGVIVNWISNFVFF